MNNIDWQAKEEKDNLKTRIAVHDQLSKREINDWILDLAGIQEGYKILDIGCGTGKQVVAYGTQCGKTGIVIGADISIELLKEAKTNAEREGINAIFQEADLNKPLKWVDGTFDIVSSCFSIYYIDNIQSGILELKRILKDGGKILIVGPSENNAREFVELHSKVNNLPAPLTAIKRGQRIRDEVIPITKTYFKDVKVDVFKNEVIFSDAESFMKYYTSTLLFKESSKYREQRMKYVEQMKRRIKRIFNKEGKYILNKEVYGVTGVK